MCYEYEKIHVCELQIQELYCSTFTLHVILEITSAYHLNGIFGNSGANSNGTIHPGGNFRRGKKGNTFQGISFFSLLPKFPKISVPFVHLQCKALHGNTSEKEC